jgi:hypothetical protein
LHIKYQVETPDNKYLKKIENLVKVLTIAVDGVDNLHHLFTTLPLTSANESQPFSFFNLINYQPYTLEQDRQLMLVSPVIV